MSSCMKSNSVQTCSRLGMNKTIRKQVLSLCGITVFLTPDALKAGIPFICCIFSLFSPWIFPAWLLCAWLPVRPCVFVCTFSLTYNLITPKSTHFACPLTLLKNPSALSAQTRCVLHCVFLSPDVCCWFFILKT